MRENSAQLRAFSYDGDGVLRTQSGASAETRRYVTPDYQVDLDSGETFVYYRFGGRIVAVGGSTSGLRYLLGDHLSSTQGELSPAQSDLAQRRYYPFGSDRAVPGASDLTRDERFTSQSRIDAGNGNSRRELYYYGARWYLPGVGIFTQPDAVVPDQGNPQALNRYAYTLNNPVKYTDPSGHDPKDWFDDYWKQEFAKAHPDDPVPDADDYAYRYITMAMATGLIPTILDDREVIYIQPGYDAPATYSADLDINIEIGEEWQKFRKGGVTNETEALLAFAKLVNTGGLWDFKNQAYPRCSKETAHYLYEDFGNFHFGVVGTAWGYSKDFLMYGAGVAQQYSNWRQERAGEHPAPTTGDHGDYGRDEVMITQGVNFYNLYRSLVVDEKDKY